MLQLVHARTTSKSEIVVSYIFLPLKSTHKFSSLTCLILLFKLQLCTCSNGKSKERFSCIWLTATLCAFCHILHRPFDRKEWCLQLRCCSSGVAVWAACSGQEPPIWTAHLVEWARPYITNKRRVISSMSWTHGWGSQYSLPAAQKTALCYCLRCRPGMDQVVTVLEQLQESKSATKTGK